MLTYFCWHCYGQTRRDRGRCEHCGQEIAPPAEATFDDRLLWALDHPLADRRMLAVHALAERQPRRARERLRALLDDQDSYVAAAAVDALVAIDGAEAQHALLEELSRSGPATVRAAARQHLTGGHRRTAR